MKGNIPSVRDHSQWNIFFNRKRSSWYLRSPLVPYIIRDYELFSPRPPAHQKARLTTINMYFSVKRWKGWLFEAPARIRHPFWTATRGNFIFLNRVKSCHQSSRQTPQTYTDLLYTWNHENLQVRDLTISQVRQKGDVFHDIRVYYFEAVWNIL